ncbi:MAG: cell division protein FtsA [Inquilinus sp.]|nr:cell division protein FtsA [Inquilinus sp.]
MGFNGVKRMRTRPRGELIAALDVGSTKVVCFIARADDEGRPLVIGIGHQISRGLRSGVVVDMEAAEKAIGHAVSSAEQMAGEQIREVVVNVVGGHLSSQIVGVELPIAGHAVSESDLRRATKINGRLRLPAECEIVHTIPVGYAIDGSRGIRDPRGMLGNHLGVELHVISAGAAALRNLTTCINRCHLEVDAVVASPYAAGLACLVEDERDLGCTIIDMGGGTTGIGVFSEGRLVFADCIPIGGSHVTNDVARGLTTPLLHAERMKTLHGHAIPSLSDDRELIDAPQVGEDPPSRANHVPKSLLTGIIRPRLEEVFEMVRGRLEDSGFDKISGRRVVLAGGGSQLHGVRELAQMILDKQVRLGRPIGIEGLAEATGGPAFATAAGLLTLAARHRTDPVLAGVMAGGDVAEPGHGLWHRLGGWFRENLGDF